MYRLLIWSPSIGDPREGRGYIANPPTCVVEFSYFCLCNVLCRKGSRSSAVYLGDFPR